MPPRQANYEALPRAVFTDPQAAAVDTTDACFSATVALKDVPQNRLVHARLSGVERIPYTLERRRTPEGRLRARPGGGRMDAAGHIGDPGARPARGADTIQPFPTFSDIFSDALHAVHAAIRKPVGALFSVSEARS